MKSLLVRLAQTNDRQALAGLRNALWPESSVEEHDRELELILAGKFLTVMPLVILVAQSLEDSIVGFIEVGLRSSSDGCDPAFPVGYVEGWYVSENHRKQGVGTQLLKAAEEWARDRGCREMASDTQFDNYLSQRVHKALGFEVAERSVIYRKPL